MNDQLDKILEGLDAVRNATSPSDLAELTPAVAYLRGALNAVADPIDRGVLLTLLASEYASLQLISQEEEVRREAARTSPDDPGRRIGLAMLLLLNGRPDEALEEAERAVEVSKQTGKFNRHALQTVARCLKQKGDYSRLASVIRDLMDLKAGVPDVRVERDFLVGLPADAIPQDLLDAYLKQT